MIDVNLTFDGFHKKNWTEVGSRDLFVFLAYHVELTATLYHKELIVVMGNHND